MLKTRLCSPRGIRLACLVLVLLAVAWRLPFAASLPVTTVDEVRFTQPTIERLVNGEWLLYISGTNYGAPVQEALSASLHPLLGRSALALRLPVVLLGALAIFVAFRSLRETVDVPVALSIAALLTFGNSAVCRYTTFAHPCYATLFVCVGLIQLATFWTDRSRTPGRWLVLGLLMGFSLYLLKLSLIQSGVSLLWLWWRSDQGQRSAGKLGSAPGYRVILGFAGLAAAGLAVFPVVYRYLTRRNTYEMTSPEMALLGVAAVALSAGVILLSTSFALPRRREWLALSLCVVSLAIVPVPAALWYARVEQPRLEERGIESYGEIAYSWKHLHDWPKQVRILSEGVFPALLLGRYAHMEHSPEAAWPLGWKTGVTLLAVITFGVGAVRRSRGSLDWLRPSEKDWVLILPFFATLLVLLPSWSLFGDPAYRYLLAFLPGFYLLAFRCLEQPIRRHWRATVVLLVGYIVYCGIDCILHVTS